MVVYIPPYIGQDCGVHSPIPVPDRVYILPSLGGMVVYIPPSLGLDRVYISDRSGSRYRAPAYSGIGIFIPVPVKYRKLPGF